MSRLNARSVSLLAGRGVEWDPRLCVSGFRRPGPCAHRTLDKFLPAGGSGGPVHAAPHSFPPPECARPAPLASLFGLVQEALGAAVFPELFSRLCYSSGGGTDLSRGGVCMWPGAGRRGGGGRLGTSGFGVQAGLICILVGHFLIA